jgi:hypothetical protein
MAFENDPVGAVTTVVMTVDAFDKVALYAGGGKISEQKIDTGFVPAAGALSTLRFGATDPSGFDPASLVLRDIRAWPVSLTEDDARLVSGNLDATPASGSGRLPIIGMPTSVTVLEGEVVQIPLTKTGTGAASVVLRTLSLGAAAGSDYAALQETVSFESDTATVTVDLVTLTDVSPETSEYLALELAQPNNCLLGNAVCVVRIREFLNGFSDHFTAEFFSPVTPS